MNVNKEQNGGDKLRRHVFKIPAKNYMVEVIEPNLHPFNRSKTPSGVGGGPGSELNQQELCRSRICVRASRSGLFFVGQHIDPPPLLMVLITLHPPFQVRQLWTPDQRHLPHRPSQQLPQRYRQLSACPGRNLQQGRRYHNNQSVSIRRFLHPPAR